MDWLFEANRDAERRFPWISIPGVASIVIITGAGHIADTNGVIM